MILCLGDLMIVLDTTVVNVALPSIRADLGFSETSLAWVVNAYLLTFGGFLLLGGRLGDLYGHRRLFLGGIALFTVASLACGLATVAGAPDRGARRAGPRRRGRLGRRALADHARCSPSRPSAPRRWASSASWRRAAARIGVLARRRAHRRAVLALDLPDQPADRHRGLRADADAHPGQRGPAQRRQRLDVAGAVTVTHRRHPRHLRDRQRQRGGLGLRADARPAGVSRRAARRRSWSSSRASRRRSCRSACSGCATSPSRTSSASSGRRRCSPGSSSRRSTCSRCSTTRPMQVGLAFLPANLIMGAFSARHRRQARDALRRPRCRWPSGSALSAARAAAVGARAGRRHAS